MPNINDPLQEQMERMTARAEASRARMLDEIQRQRMMADQQLSRSQGFMDRATSATFHTARSTMQTAYRHAAPPMAAGAGYVGAHTPALGSQVMQAFGVGGGIFAQGPQLRGGEGSYYGGSQSFGGLLYEAGLGQALQSTIGMGMFFQDVNQRFGVAPGVIQEAARDELALRFESVGNRFMSSLPMAGRIGTRFNAMEEDIQRGMSRRLSFMRSQGLAGAKGTGRGFRSSSYLVERMAQSQTDAMSKINRQLGYGLSDEDAQQMMATGMATFDDFELERDIRGGDTQGLTQKLKSATQGVHKAAQQLRVDAKELQAFRESMKVYADSAGTLAAEAEVGRDIQAGFTVGSPQAALHARRQYFREAYALGVDDLAGQRGYGMQQARRVTNLYDSAVRGEMDPQTLAMYGGATRDEQARIFRQRTAQYGLQAMNDPALRGQMYQDPGYTQSLLAGRGGGVMGRLQAQAGAQLANPFAPTLALYDERTRETAANSGLLSQFRMAQQHTEMMRPFYDNFNLSESEIENMTAHQLAQQTGMDPIEARRRAAEMRGNDEMMTSILGSKADGKAGAALMHRARAVSPGATPEASAALLKAARAAGMNPEDLTEDQIRNFITANTDDANVSAARRRVAGFDSKSRTTTRRVMGDPKDFNRPSISTTKRRQIKNGRIVDEFGDEGLETSEWKKMVSDLLALGKTPEEINAALEQAGAGNQFRVDEGGDLKVWSHGDGGWTHTDNVGDYSIWASNWADGRLGDDEWQRKASVGMYQALSAMGDELASRGITPVKARAADMKAFRGDLTIDEIMSGSGKSMTDKQLGFRRAFSANGDNRIQGSELTTVLGESRAKNLLREYYSSQGMKGDALKNAMAGITDSKSFGAAIDAIPDEQRAVLRALTAEHYVAYERSKVDTAARARADGSSKETALWVREAKE